MLQPADPPFCGRSNITFKDAEGAFVANVDGPLRAIRSYVGANSGPYTQRTIFFYRDRLDIVTDLRVHAIPGIVDSLDWSTAAIGMTYRSTETAAAGVTIDGAPDSLLASIPDYEWITGSPGTVMFAGRIETSAPVGSCDNTDPTIGAAEMFRGVRTFRYGAPADHTKVAT